MQGTDERSAAGLTTKHGPDEARLIGYPTIQALIKKGREFGTEILCIAAEIVSPIGMFKLIGQ
jgi:hypothetical protein